VRWLAFLFKNTRKGIMDSTNIYCHMAIGGPGSQWFDTVWMKMHDKLHFSKDFQPIRMHGGF